MIRLIITTIGLMVSGSLFYSYDPLQMFHNTGQDLKSVTSEQLDVPKVSNHVPRHIQEQQEQISLDSILSQYEEQLSLLHEEVEGRIQKVLSTAMEDYYEAKDNDQGQSVTSLFFKYRNVIEHLELQADESFAEIYENLERELEQHGYGKSDALPIKQHYEEIKEATKASIIREARGKF
ncbi:hypothetical protein [Salirhabdus salicampi]|uniref:hypothetical protein n=1 Tax=Salirhabdus salicampi TaxID=476102 RepID=UPI0020C594BC|nr:hypothetical protein [Salirhabdus salicampi]MCP8617585.1 hypothetical protein [Salirhabdus salicampi]